MLRRQARLRREYLYRKSVEDKHKQLQEKKDRLKRSLEEGIPIHGDLRREAIALQDKLKWTDQGIVIFIQIKKKKIYEKYLICNTNRTRSSKSNSRI